MMANFLSIWRFFTQWNSFTVIWEICLAKIVLWGRPSMKIKCTNFFLQWTFLAFSVILEIFVVVNNLRLKETAKLNTWKFNCDKFLEQRILTFIFMPRVAICQLGGGGKTEKPLAKVNSQRSTFELPPGCQPRRTSHIQSGSHSDAHTLVWRVIRLLHVLVNKLVLV